MIEAICAGIVIGLGCVANLYVGGIMGSILYAIVIMSVIYYDLDLWISEYEVRISHDPYKYMD